MELVKIEELIEKYLNAETSLQEEKVLQEYFISNNVPVHLQEFGILFGYYKESKAQTYTQPIRLNPEIRHKKRQWLSIAASIVILISGFIGKNRYDIYQRNKKFAQVKRALKMVSMNLNKGNDALYSVSYNVTKGKKALGKVGTFSKTMHRVKQVIKN